MRKHREHDRTANYPAFFRTWLGAGNDIGEFWLLDAWAGAVEYALTNPHRLVSMFLGRAKMAASSITERQHVRAAVSPDFAADNWR
jgi:hypothetical protein